MDRPIDTPTRRRQTLKRLSLAVISVAALAAAYVFGSALITPTMARARIRTAVVDRGTVEAVTTASGTVVAEVEQVLSSPIDARVLRILKRPGDAVARGDAIVELDTSATRLELEKIDQNIAIKANAQQSVRLDLEKTLGEIQSQIDAKRLDLKAIVARNEESRKLAASGLLSAGDLRDAELREAKTRIELDQLEGAMRSARESTRTRIEGLDLEMATLRKERVEAERQLRLATMASDRDGVLTWVVTEEGATIPRGSVVARIADLGSFRVDATVSDVHAQQVTPGLGVKVKINDEMLDGHVAAVLPRIENGTVALRVALDDPASPLLKANLRVDVLVVTARRDGVLRVKKGPFANVEGAHDVFVVRGDRAERVNARFGVAGVDAFEIVSGLAEGDEVVVSDTRDYAHMREIKIR
jgi:HlyD family secretion protein